MARGGYREGAGRPPKVAEGPPQKAEIKTANIDTDCAKDEPESIYFFRQLMKNNDVDLRIRMDAARQLLPYQARRLGETGKKEEREKKAKQAASKFATPQPPKLVSGGK
jgi:phage terminase small subunit